jgi:hypothetical protein
MGDFITNRDGKFLSEIIKSILPKMSPFLLEKQIDGLVYDLYGLTEEEVKIIEGKTK